MRTTIEPKLNLAAAPSKAGRKSSGDSVPTSHFDDALKSAQPREKSLDETSAIESRKSNEPKKKAVSKQEKSNDSAPVDESADASQKQETKDIKPAIEGEQSTESDVTDEESDQPIVGKDEEPAAAEIKDPLALHSLLTPPPQNADLPDGETMPEIVGEGEVVAGQSPPQLKLPGQEQVPGSPAGEETDADGATRSQLAAAAPVQTESESEPRESALELELSEESSSIESKQPANTREAAVSLPKAQESVAAGTHPVTDSAQATDLQPSPAPLNVISKTPAPATPEPQPQVVQDTRFAEDNHPKIVTGIRGELLPTGGKMTLRLDPPELGALQVQVHLQDGAMTATFQTSNDEATRLLSHSLANLKNSLESQGIHVDKLQVQQAPRDQQSSNNPDSRDSQQQSQWDNHSAKQEQQRREMLQRMWRKLAGVEDPLDLVA